MNTFLKCQRNTKLIIDGYIRDQVPDDIETEIHRKFIGYQWNTKSLFECNHEQFKDIIILSKIQLLNDNVHNIFDDNKLLFVLRDNQMNGEQFRSLGKEKWMMLLKDNNVCSKGTAMKLWIEIKKFELTSIKHNTPIYLPLH